MIGLTNWICYQKLQNLNHNQLIQTLLVDLKENLRTTWEQYHGIKDYLMPLQEVIRFKLIPSIIGEHICSNGEGVMLSPPAIFDGLGVPLFHKNADIEFENSKKLKSKVTDLIKNQSLLYSYIKMFWIHCKIV